MQSMQGSLPLLTSTDAPASLRRQAEAVLKAWASDMTRRAENAIPPWLAGQLSEEVGDVGENDRLRRVLMIRSQQQ